MILKNFKQRPKSLMLLGMMFTALGGIMNVFMRRAGLLPENTVDFITGLFYGCSFAAFGLFVYLRRKNAPRA